MNFFRKKEQNKMFEDGNTNTEMPFKIEEDNSDDLDTEITKQNIQFPFENVDEKDQHENKESEKKFSISDLGIPFIPYSDVEIEEEDYIMPQVDEEPNSVFEESVDVLEQPKEDPYADSLLTKNPTHSFVQEVNDAFAKNKEERVDSTTISYDNSELQIEYEEDSQSILEEYIYVHENKTEDTTSLEDNTVIDISENIELFAVEETDNVSNVDTDTDSLLEIFIEDDSSYLGDDKYSDFILKEPTDSKTDTMEEVTDSHETNVYDIDMDINTEKPYDTESENVLMDEIDIFSINENDIQHSIEFVNLEDDKNENADTDNSEEENTGFELISQTETSIDELPKKKKKEKKSKKEKLPKEDKLKSRKKFWIIFVLISIVVITAALLFTNNGLLSNVGNQIKNSSLGKIIFNSGNKVVHTEYVGDNNSNNGNENPSDNWEDPLNTDELIDDFNPNQPNEPTETPVEDIIDTETMGPFYGLITKLNDDELVNSTLKIDNISSEENKLIINTELINKFNLVDLNETIRHIQLTAFKNEDNKSKSIQVNVHRGNNRYTYETSPLILDFLHNLKFQERHSTHLWWTESIVLKNGLNYKNSTSKMNLYVETIHPIFDSSEDINEENEIIEAEEDMISENFGIDPNESENLEETTINEKNNGNKNVVKNDSATNNSITGSTRLISSELSKFNSKIENFNFDIYYPSNLVLEDYKLSNNDNTIEFISTDKSYKFTTSLNKIKNKTGLEVFNERKSILEETYNSSSSNSKYVYDPLSSVDQTISNYEGKTFYYKIYKVKDRETLEEKSAMIYVMGYEDEQVYEFFILHKDVYNAIDQLDDWRVLFKLSSVGSLKTMEEKTFNTEEDTEVNFNVSNDAEKLSNYLSNLTKPNN